MDNKATFAAGCFWHVQAKFDEIDGVLSTTVGFTGGAIDQPSYEQVCQDNTGHAEAIEIIYDPKKISYENLLDYFWQIHDPTTLNRQGGDIGKQYRSAIFYHDDEQKALATASKAAQEKLINKPIVTEIVAANLFYPAMEDHQKYLAKRCKIG